MHPRHIMVLSFNYTDTARKYTAPNILHNYIHGDLEHPENIIFGYGDELDKRYQDILEKIIMSFLEMLNLLNILKPGTITIC